MPLPLLAWAAIAAGTAIIGGSAYAYATRSEGKVGDNQDKVISISIIGPRMAGKSTLANFLERGELKHDLAQNVSTVKRSAGTWEYKNGKASFVSFDESGSQDTYPNWKKSFEESGFALYLFNILDLLDKSEKPGKRIVDDFYQIGSWIKSDRKKVVLVLTHEDKIINSEGLSTNRSSEIFDSINSLEVVKRVKDFIPASCFGMVIGSLANVESAKLLVDKVKAEAGND